MIFLKKILTIFFIITFTILLNGCFNNGNLDEGECIGHVTLENIPDKLLNEKKDYDTVISIGLENVISKRSYTIRLTKDNSFYQKLSIPAGTYSVNSTYFYSRNYKNVEVASRDKKVTFTKDNESFINVYLLNGDNLVNLSTKETPSDKILNCDKFSNMMQVNGKIFSMFDILNYIHFNCDKNISPHEEVTLYTEDHTISVTLFNAEDYPQYWNQCKVKSISARRNNVVFSGGLNVDMTIPEIVHAKKGIYGKPDKLSGNIFWNSDLSSTRIIYNDSNTGNSITINANTSNYIANITFDFQQF